MQPWLSKLLPPEDMEAAKLSQFQNSRKNPPGGSGHVAPGVVGAAYQWPRFHMAKPHFVRGSFEFVEFFRRDVALDLQLARRWLEVLADGDDIDLMRAQVAQRGQHFIGGFADAEHEARFGEHLHAAALCLPQNIQRAFIAVPGTDFTVKSRHSLYVVIEDFDAGIDDG